MRTKLSALIILAAVAAIAAFGVVGAIQPQPFIMVWITKSNLGGNVWTLTYKNFGFRNIAKVEVTVVSQVAISKGSTILRTYDKVSIKGWVATLASGQQINWQATSNHVEDYKAFNFYVSSTPCTLQYTIYDKDSNILRTGTVSIA